MKKVLSILVMIPLTSIAQIPNTTSYLEYEFEAPNKWQMIKKNDHLLLAQSPNHNEGCVIQILPLQQSTGNLENDAVALWDVMYSGWEYRFTGERMFTATTGRTYQGLEFYLIEAPMKRSRGDGYYYDYEDGKLFVVKGGNKIAIVASRHERLIRCECYHNYDRWNRFFNSFTIKNETGKKLTKEENEKNIVGIWQSFSTGAIGDFLFAANGQFKVDGALGSVSSTKDERYEYIQYKVSSFQGDGKYSVDGDEIIMQRRGSSEVERAKFRFAKANMGGAGWKERLVVIKNGVTGLYEVSYDRIK